MLFYNKPIEPFEHIEPFEQSQTPNNKLQTKKIFLSVKKIKIPLFIFTYQYNNVFLMY